MTKILLIRHGEISLYSPRRFIGRTDLTMTENGRQQMSCLAAYVASFQVDRFVCSSLSRCIESCEIVAARFAASHEIISGLDEIGLGSWEGLTVAEVKKRFPGSYERRGEDMAGFRPEGGESFRDLQNRCWPVLEKIVCSTKGTVAIVAHAGVNRVLLCRILGMPLENLFRIDQEYGCLNVIECHQDRYRLSVMNDCRLDGRKNGCCVE